MLDDTQTEIYQRHHCVRDQLKPSAFVPLQSELILLVSTDSAWGLCTARSVVVCSEPIKTTESKQNPTRSCQSTQQTPRAPSSSGRAALLWCSTNKTFTALLRPHLSCQIVYTPSFVVLWLLPTVEHHVSESSRLCFTSTSCGPQSRRPLHTRKGKES